MDTAKLNFVQFATQFKVVNKKLVTLPDNVVPRIFPTYSSIPRASNFPQYCKYQLLRHKPWKKTQENAWDNEETSDENMINKWKQFLRTLYAEANVPEWFDKLQSVIHSQHETEDQHVDTHPEDTREEWMVISDLHVPFIDSSQTNSELSGGWDNDRCHYSEQQIGEMPAWIKNMREQSNQASHEQYEGIPVDPGTFSEMQRLAYNIVQTHFQDMSSSKDPLAFINGVAGTGKSYLINGTVCFCMTNVL